jgi:aminoglycoside/choline kinase family phosphotransferase
MNAAAAAGVVERSERRLQWTREVLGMPSLQLESASSDASFRSYWRTVGTTPSWIVMDAPPGREDVRPWIEVAARLRAGGLDAPEVRAANLDEGFLLISDLGTQLYLPALNDASVDALYDAALDALFALATRVDASGLPPYDEARLVAEMELLPTWFVQRHLGVAIECEEWDVVESAFRALVTSAQQQPAVFVHRDFHSRNLLLPRSDATGPGIIDFQDAVRGPVTYDLVSLLRDCYIVWPDERVHATAERFRIRLEGAGLAVGGAARFRRAFDLMGLQRHIKVLGIFCRLWYRDGKAGYLGDLPRVWNYVRDVGARHPETAPLVDLLARWIGLRDLTHATP